MLGAPVYLALQYFVPRRLSGGWRWAALAPLLFAIPLVLFCLYALGQGSNLWPLMFILFAPFGAAYLALLEFTRRFVR